MIAQFYHNRAPPFNTESATLWIPAFAGMTGESAEREIPPFDPAAIA